MPKKGRRFIKLDAHGRLLIGTVTQVDDSATNLFACLFVLEPKLRSESDNLFHDD